ncbi:hypothetical protein MRX96_051130, partial [Rhipicephalus microplus]
MFQNLAMHLPSYQDGSSATSAAFLHPGPPVYVPGTRPLVPVPHQYMHHHQMSSMGGVATSSASSPAAPSVAVSSMAAASMPAAPVSPAVAPPPPTSSPARGHHHHHHHHHNPATPQPPPHQHSPSAASVQGHSGHLGGVWGQAGASGVTSVAAASCREGASAYLSRAANGLGSYAYMGTEVTPWVGVESSLSSIQGGASPFARIT